MGLLRGWQWGTWWNSWDFPSCPGYILGLLGLGTIRGWQWWNSWDFPSCPWYILGLQGLGTVRGWQRDMVEFSGVGILGIFPSCPGYILGLLRLSTPRQEMAVGHGGILGISLDVLGTSWDY